MSEYKPIEVRARIENEYRVKKAVVHHAEGPGQEAHFMLRLIERWGMVAGMTDGEDSSGRQKLRLATPEELVERAASVTMLLFQRFRDDGLLVQMPIPLSEVEEQAQAQAQEAKTA